MTYRELAIHLRLSESTIKQMFSSGNVSLKRLEAICDILKIDIGELIVLSQRDGRTMETLDQAREQALVDDPKLLLVAYCLVNHWTADEILERYTLLEAELITLLAKLDKMQLIELLPNNRVRLLIANNFKWLPNGPIAHFFETQVQGEFLNDNFSADGAIRLIKNGDITRASQLFLIEKMELIAESFDEVREKDRKSAMKDRRGTTMILAMRNWQFTAFQNLERPE